MALGLIFVLTLIDGLFLIGLIINGWGAFAACVYAYTKFDISIVTIAIVAFFGVFLGENLSYFFARYFRDSIQRWVILTFRKLEQLRSRKYLAYVIPKVNEETWEKAHRKINNGKDGWVLGALIVGRWTPVASLMPASCAVSGVAFSRFCAASAMGCALWSGLWNLVIWLAVNGYAEIVDLPN